MKIPFGKSHVDLDVPQVRAVLVEVVDDEFIGCLHRDIKDAKKAYVKADTESQTSKTKFRLHVQKRLSTVSDCQLQVSLLT